MDDEIFNNQFIANCLQNASGKNFENWLKFGKDMDRDQPNSWEKMHDFTAEFLKCVKFHGKFTESVSEIHGPHRRYFEVLR